MKKKNCTLILIFMLMLSLVFSQAFAQSVSVNGRVTSSRIPMRYVAVTFVDDADTTRQFTAVTDNRGDYQVDIPTSVASDAGSVPTRFELAQSYPNPFSGATVIPYQLATQSDIHVSIFDIKGRIVKEFSAGMQGPGAHNLLWDGRNAAGQRVANGIYFYRLQSGDQAKTGKMVFNTSAGESMPVAPSVPAPVFKSNNAGKISLQAGTYTIRVENTEESLPLIAAEQLKNVSIYQDTTISFNVDYIPTSVVDFGTREQIIRGFGAANIILWRPDMTASEVETAFGNEEGQLGFSILRLMVEANKNRWSLYIPRAKQAYEMGATIIASPWHAPSEMTETVNGVVRVRHDMYAEYAAHLDSFVTFMEENGVPIYGLSVQNEPDITDQWTSWTADEMFTFMRDYAHAITGTKVMAPESFQFRRNISDPILNDATALENTDIICGHIYGGGLAYYSLAREKGKEVWMTEHLSGEDPDEAYDWSWALAAGVEINDVMRAGMNAYVWWYIVRYYGPIDDGTLHPRHPKGLVTKKGYVMSQFSKFIRPEDYRVNSITSPSVSGFNISAYIDSSSSKHVIVAINESDAPVEIALKVKNQTLETYNSYTTSEAKDVEKGDDVTLNAGQFMIQLEPSSITTFIAEE